MNTTLQLAPFPRCLDSAPLLGLKSPDLNLRVEKFGVEMFCNGLIELAMES